MNPPTTTDDTTPAGPAPLRTIALADFLAQDYPDPVFIVDDLLCEGINMIAGPPKVGKTWLAMRLCLAVYQGGEFLGRTLTSREVLYLSLESSQNWIQRRWRQFLGDVDPADVPAGLELGFESLKLGQGFEEQVASYIDARDDVGLIVIDTMVRVDPADFTGGRTGYQQDAATLEGVTNLARRYPGVAFVFLHHTREAKASNPLDALNGSRGLSGTLDGCWLLDDLESDEDDLVQLSFVNRNAPPVQPLAISMGCNGSFDVRGPASDFVGGELNREILDLLRTNPDGMTPKALSQALAEPGGKIRQYLCRLKKAGKVRRTSEGYVLVPTGWDDPTSMATDPIDVLVGAAMERFQAEYR